MVGIIKNLFSGKNNYYIELDENEAQSSSQEQTSQKTEEKAEKNAKPQKANQAQKQPSFPKATVTTQQPPVSVQNNGSVKINQLAGETFAPNYLMPKATNRRRRPGANMSEFMELARDVKAPRNQ